MKKTYEKQKYSLDGKNFVCRKLYGGYFDKNPYCYGYDINKGTKNLTREGKIILTTFIKQNRRKELKKEEEEKNRTQRISTDKKPIWAKTGNRIEYFGGPLIDYKYEFIKPKPLKHLINQPPFRRPKEKGDYLNKDMNVFGDSRNV